MEKPMALGGGAEQPSAFAQLPRYAAWPNLGGTHWPHHGTEGISWIIM